MSSRGLVLSLCDYSGAWSKPYADAGYQVVMVDVKHPPGTTRVSDSAWTIGDDVTTLKFDYTPHAVLAAPPCTCFCRPGARWWKRQDERGETARDVAVFRACLRICQTATAWWPWRIRLADTSD